MNMEKATYVQKRAQKYIKEFRERMEKEQPSEWDILTLSTEITTDCLNDLDSRLRKLENLITRDIAISNPHDTTIE